MSVLLKNFKPRQILHIHKVLSSVPDDGVRKCHWYTDYIPGPYPKTTEEREKAAKKYNLLPEEYNPYPDDERGCGDYPKLPYHSVDSKDPWYPWDIPKLRRNFNEPVHFEMMHLTPEGISTAEKSSTKDFFLFIKFVLIMGSTLYIITNIKILNHQSEKQYPAPGVVHYTFDLDHKKKIKIRDPACDEA